MKVTYKDHMGSDNCVVDAARVSFNKKSDNYDEERNLRLIRYLAKNNHWTPFANGGTIKLHFKVPIFVARQLQKHQAGFEPQSEISRRYVTDIPELFYPKMWRRAASNVKQGSSDEEHVSYQRPFQLQREMVELYLGMVGDGCCPEQARMVLPQSMYTEYVWKGNLYAWANLYNTRSDAHAQREVQEVAKQISEIIEPLFPESWKALTS